MSFFQGLVLLIVLFFLGILVLVPTYVRLTKHTMYDEFKKIWWNEVEAKKRELAMQEVNLQKTQTTKIGKNKR